jgi:hypothetical protein
MSTSGGIRRRAKQEIRRGQRVEAGFTAFMDHTVAGLVAVGLDDVQAIEAIFTVAEHLHEEGVLPEFPDDSATALEAGTWLVRAHDFDFPKFVLEAVLAQGDADGV